ncbi:unnamed protein product [Mytilus coruscus]|uniref:Uncharacterized protein n=1 Tax=Mytilus coruscus TaxID=42192 RepID=A0A6J8E415_MYTCO|nr:unnamed protein product [Mytilus coruscus]
MEPPDQPIPKLINLTSNELSPDQIYILSKGLKFTPTPQKSNYTEIQDDISNFCRKLRLTEEFFDQDNEDESLVRNKSDYTPPRGINLTLDKYCEYITDFPYENIQHQRIKSNLKKTDWNIISDLQNNKNIVIKEADKGSAVFIMGTDYYKNLILNMLQDYTYYESVANYKQQKIIAKLIVLVNLYRKGLTKKECDYITNFKCKTSQIYGLPKIHKSQKITEACKLTKSSCINICAPNDLKMRPIVAGPACETHRLSNFLDILLKPFLKHIKF